jgi:hypothetical protein
MQRNFAAHLLVFASCADTSSSDGSDTTDATSPAAAYPGAPDEQCHLNPAKVYVHETWGTATAGLPGAIHALVDLEDPSVLCAFWDPRRDATGLLHPVDGSFVSLQGDPGSRITVVKTPNDWLKPSGISDYPWTTGERDDNDQVLGEVMYASAIVCGEEGNLVHALWADEATVYASCGGTVFNAPQLTGIWTNPVVGMLDGRRIFAALDYYAEADDGGDPEEIKVPIPGDVDSIQHLAARPEGDHLLAAMYVWRGGVSTIERGQVTPNGVTLVGAYTDVLETSGVTGFSSFAIAADGTLYALGGVGDALLDEIFPGEPDGDDTIVRLPISGAPQVVYQPSPETPDPLPRLAWLGNG